MFATPLALTFETTLWVVAIGMVVLLAIYLLFSSGSTHHKT